LQVQILSPLREKRITSAKQKEKGRSMTDKLANATLDGARPNVFIRARDFIRDVISELKKVVWPTQRQLINYTIIVLVFVVIMASIIAAYDFSFTQITLRIFGN
jgi:preprotein translocase subunit SecE